MSDVSLPSYHRGLLRGFLLGHDAPVEVMSAVESLYAAAIQAPLQDDLIDSVRRINQAAERLVERLGDVPIERKPMAAVQTFNDEETQSATMSDEAKIAAHVAQHGITRVDGEKPKRKHNMSPEAREAAARRMRDMWVRKRADGQKASNDDYAGEREDEGNGSAPEVAGAPQKVFHASGLEMDPRTGAIKLF